MITIKQIKQIASDLKSYDGWVNDSHTSSKYKGFCMGLDMLVKQLEELQTTKNKQHESRNQKSTQLYGI